MVTYEYKVIPAPRDGVRTKGAKGISGRFAGALEQAMNKLGADGWEYIRADTLPVDERNGITRRKTETYQSVLVFRRQVEEAAVPETFEEAAAEVEDDLFEDINDDIQMDDDIVEHQEDPDDAHFDTEKETLEEETEAEQPKP
jgi:hypothetical protein